MIISYRHKFAFIAVPKTASSSIISALKKYDLGFSKACKLVGASVHREFRFRNILKAHMPAEELKNKLGIKYDDLFTFAFVRNPWERIVSLYFYQLKRGRVPKSKSFRDFVIQFEDWSKVLQSGRITDRSGKIIVDFVGRYENLQDDFNFVCDKIKIPRINLSYVNRTKHGVYSGYYDDETKKIIAEKTKIDIEKFKYEFGK